MFRKVLSPRVFLDLGGPAGGSNPDGFSPHTRKYTTWLVHTYTEYFIEVTQGKSCSMMLTDLLGKTWSKMKVFRRFLQILSLDFRGGSKNKLFQIKANPKVHTGGPGKFVYAFNFSVEVSPGIVEN